MLPDWSNAATPLTAPPTKLPSAGCNTGLPSLAARTQRARECWRPAPTPSVGSFTPARAPLLEVLEDFLFGDSFGGKSRLQPRGCFLERGAIGFRALAPRRNVVADRIPVARNRYRHVALKEIVGEFFS